MTDRAVKEALVDCDRGRVLGCASFCCALIVRLRDGETDPGRPDKANGHCLDKDPVSGRCVYQEPSTGRCKVWSHRPAVCREYDCSDDPKLAIVQRNGFTSLMTLVRLEIGEGFPHCPSRTP